MIAKKWGMPLENHGCGAIIIARRGGGRQNRTAAAFFFSFQNTHLFFSYSTLSESPAAATGGGGGRSRRTEPRSHRLPREECQTASSPALPWKKRFPQFEQVLPGGVVNREPQSGAKIHRRRGKKEKWKIEMPNASKESLILIGQWPVDLTHFSSKVHIGDFQFLGAFPHPLRSVLLPSYICHTTAYFSARRSVSGDGKKGTLLLESMAPKTVLLLLLLLLLLLRCHMESTTFSSSLLGRRSGEGPAPLKS